MPNIHLETFIAAPIQHCFDLMRDVDTHTRSTAQTRERTVTGKTSGLLVRGAFKAFTHRHAFREVPAGTVMVDDFN